MTMRFDGRVDRFELEGVAQASLEPALAQLEKRSYAEKSRESIDLARRRTRQRDPQPGRSRWGVPCMTARGRDRSWQQAIALPVGAEARGNNSAPRSAGCARCLHQLHQAGR